MKNLQELQEQRTAVKKYIKGLKPDTSELERELHDEILSDIEKEIKEIRRQIGYLDDKLHQAYEKLEDLKKERTGN